jgi:hypothetical protein
MCCQATDDEETIRQIKKHGFGDQLRWSRLRYTPHAPVSGQDLTKSSPALVDALRLAHEEGAIRREFTEREWRLLGMEVDLIDRGFFVNFTDSKGADVYYGPDPGINEYKNYPVVCRKRANGSHTVHHSHGIPRALFSAARRVRSAGSVSRRSPSSAMPVAASSPSLVQTLSPIRTTTMRGACRRAGRPISSSSKLSSRRRSSGASALYGTPPQTPSMGTHPLMTWQVRVLRAAH